MHEAPDEFKQRVAKRKAVLLVGAGVSARDLGIEWHRGLVSSRTVSASAKNTSTSFPEAGETEYVPISPRAIQMIS